ncbi:MAG: hypothetical protein KGS72_11035 [Cyanobacteria bacterium REEB67]|nr:hypothetical protein [Cyanobacteria bacterium REEB67]
MPGGRDYNQQRPPRRKSWEENGEVNSEENSEENAPGEASYSSGFGRNVRRPARPLDNDNPPEENGRGNVNEGSAGEPPSYSAAFGAAGQISRPDKRPEQKTQKKRLLKLVGNEALCLIVIFGMIAAFNWTATDFSGDYMGRNRQLGPVRLSLTKHGENLGGELDYGHHGFLNMVEGEDANKPQSGQPFTINFVETAQWHRQGFIPWRASFTGRIDSGQAVGTVTDRTGQYKVTMEKNVLTSLFRQTQDRIPQVPAVPLPSLFNEKDKGIRGVIPNNR